MTHETEDEQLTDARKEAFPAILKAFRKEYGLTQQQLADHLEISRNTLKSWERGDPKRWPHVLTREGVFGRLTELFPKDTV